MKRIIVVGSILLLILLSVPQISASPPVQEPDKSVGKDEPLPPIRTAGIIPEPDATDSVFVSNRGDLDQYLFRGEGSGPNGELTFYIPITRYYFNTEAPPTFDANGFISANDLQDLINHHILPETAKLRLHVYDVDEDAPSPYCAEVDHVTVNDEPLGPNGSQVKLSGANDTWSTVSFDIPIGVLKFPTAKGQNGQSPTSVDNEIKVDIDVNCLTNWAVEVDWGVIEIPSPIRPLVFVHGWRGETTSFEAFQGFASQDGIPTAEPVDLLRGIYPINPTTSNLLALDIHKATREFGVNKVSLFAHSKGGVVARDVVRSTAFAEKVEHLITFGSPHHGTNWFQQGGAYAVCFGGEFGNGADTILCWQAASELSIGRMREYNYSSCTKQWPWSEWEGCQRRYVQQPNVDYRTFVGNADIVTNEETGTYPWNANKRPYPTTGNVDAEFGNLTHWYGHSDIKEREEVYRCAISYIDSNIHGRDNCSSVTPTGIIVTDVSGTPVIPSEDHQAVFETTGSLSASGNTTLFATVDTVEQVIFNVFTTDELASFTLQDPGGGTIIPATAGVAYYGAQQDGGEWWYQYSIDTPAAGTWQLNLNALNATDYSSNVTVKSNTKLFVKTDKYTYDHNELVTVEAALANNTTPLLGSTINLEVTRPDDSTLNLSLVDNGSNGDTTANDGIYTTQFNSSTVTGYHQLALSAANGQTNRLFETSIAVTPQTAQIQLVVSESPVDTNSNGLYDELTLNLSLNVLVAGHFEVMGTLVDSSGDPIASTSYATLRDGSGPLSTGTQTVPLTFSGSAIRNHSVNGPYTLTNVFVDDQSSVSLQVDSAENVYTTAAYQATQFEGSLLSLSSGSDTPIDSDGNGKYDILRINLSVDVVNPGTYQANGRLIDPAGDEIVWSSTSFFASNSGPQLAQIEFDGLAIGDHGVNGPYTLQDLSVANTTGLGSKIFDQVYTTQAYDFTTFERTPSITYLPIVLKNYGSDSQPPSGDTYEPNDTVQSSYGPLSPGNTYQSYIWTFDDYDGYYINVTTLDPIIIDLTNIPAGNDYDLDLFDENVNYLDGSYNDGNLSEYLYFTPPSTGKYYVLVYSFEGYSTTQPYHLRVGFNGITSLQGLSTEHSDEGDNLQKEKRRLPSAWRSD